MQGVYNTFIEKFGFQKMTIPAIDLDPQRTKLQLLVMQTEQFVKDPVNVVVKEKHFVVKNFYSTLVKEARANFASAKSQAERWVQAVVLPIEVQIKDHKQQLQSRLDNLAKINEKTTSINEQMAVLKAAEADLKRQREMIEALITRVSQYDPNAGAEMAAAAAPKAARPAPKAMPADPMQTTKLSTFEAEKTIAPAAPLMDDSAFASLVKKPEPAKPAPASAPAFDPMKTQKMDADPQSTQRLPAGHDTTQKLSREPEITQRLGESTPQPAPPPPIGEKTIKTARLDPNYRPEATQRMEASPNTTQKLDPNTQPLSNAESTQRLDDSIWKLQEAKRILQKINPK